MANLKLSVYEIVRDNAPISEKAFTRAVLKRHPDASQEQINNALANINSSNSKRYIGVRIAKGITGGYEILTPYKRRKDKKEPAKPETVREKKASVLSASSVVASLEDELEKTRGKLSVSEKGKAELKVKLNEMIALLDKE